MRTMAYGDWLHVRLESWGMRHFHAISDGGEHFIFGNGSFIVRVVKPCRRLPLGLVAIIGDDGKNEFGGEFVYADYFLPEEMDNV